MLNYLILTVVSAIVLSLELSHVAGTQLPRPRGVPISKSSLYDPARDFQCLDGSRKILFQRVNDDYCDCADGSDEPGTAACSNGYFFCQNAGHEPMWIPSSRVNDGICDCCDASDEYVAGTKCIDNCRELGREARAEAEKAAELAREGNQIRLDMSAEGKKLRRSNQEKLVKLKADYQEAERLKKEKETMKSLVEERETAALAKYKSADPEAPEQPQEESKDVDPAEYFRMIDSDESGTVTLMEIQTRVTFDRDGNGAVTEEEAMYFLGNQDEVNLEEFVEKSWPNIKPFLMREHGLFVPPSKAQEEEHGDEHLEEHTEDHPDEEEHEAEEDSEHEEEAQEEAEKEPEPEVKYDEETQALVDEANEARNQYRQAEQALLDIQNELRNVEMKTERDYGPDDVFAPLDGECFKYTDFEYVYGMCIYGKATQTAKSGGGEVLLGHWSDWTGPETSKYTRMKFDHGLKCWNGPERSATVDLRCGRENKLISVSEPNRCEYAMVYETPALCDPSSLTDDIHDEL